MEGFWLVTYVLLWSLVLFLLACVFLLFRQFGYAYLGTSAGVTRDGISLGSRAPDFAGLDTVGRELHLSDVSEPWVFLIFGRPLCPPCQALVPALNSLAHELAGEVRFIFLCQSDAELPANTE